MHTASPWPSQRRNEMGCLQMMSLSPDRSPRPPCGQNGDRYVLAALRSPGSHLALHPRGVVRRKSVCL